MVIGSPLLSFCDRRDSGLAKRTMSSGASQVGRGVSARAASGNASAASNAATVVFLIARKARSISGTAVSPEYPLTTALGVRLVWLGRLDHEIGK